MNGVRAARTALGLSQAELATHAGVTRQTLVALEGGGYAPSVYLALSVAQRLGRTVEELFDAAGPPKDHAVLDHAAIHEERTSR